MKPHRFAHALLLAASFCSVAWQSRGEEQLTAVQDALTSTTISGYVDSSGQWDSNTNAAAHGFTGTWIGIITDRSSTNRIELCVAVNAAGDFASRGMNYDRTLGSELIEGTLDRHGRAKIGQTRFYFHRNGTAKVIGRGESGRYFSARLLRERIR